MRLSADVCALWEKPSCGRMMSAMHTLPTTRYFSPRICSRTPRNEGSAGLINGSFRSSEGFPVLPLRRIPLRTRATIRIKRIRTNGARCSGCTAPNAANFVPRNVRQSNWPLNVSFLWNIQPSPDKRSDFGPELHSLNQLNRCLTVTVETRRMLHSPFSQGPTAPWAVLAAQRCGLMQLTYVREGLRGGLFVSRKAFFSGQLVPRSRRRGSGSGRAARVLQALLPAT
jgi:hypothetical protein